jgi:hypothetical protein
VVKSVTKVKHVSVEVERGSFSLNIGHSSMGWELGVWHAGELLFSATGDTKEAVLRRLDDFIAELIEVSRLVESAVKRMEEIEESFAKE